MFGNFYLLFSDMLFVVDLVVNLFGMVGFEFVEFVVFVLEVFV